MSKPTISLAEREAVEVLLGREPRGLEAIAVYDREKQPSVIRVNSVVNGQPFPTLFWLVDKKLNYLIDGLESTGVIARIQATIDNSSEHQLALADDHRQHIALRESFMSDETKRYLAEQGYFDPLQKRGIGGIANFSRVRCLHTYYAAHLISRNTVGRMMDEEYIPFC